MRTIQTIFLTIAICCFAYVNADEARSPDLHVAQTSDVSQDEAAAKVREDTGGRVLDVKTEVQDGITVYLVKVLLTDGRVRVVTVSSQ